ncbi:MAG: hypothetical protein WEA04_00380 [Candidatus Andersenbacteria bacterium]
MRTVSHRNFFHNAAFLLLLSFVFGFIDQYAIARILRSFAELTLIFVLPSAALARIINKHGKLKLDAWEELTIASAIAFLVIPAVLSIAIAVAGVTYTFLPHAIALTGLALYSFFGTKGGSTQDKLLPPQTSVFWPVAGIHVLTALVMISAYPTLPDLDPYYWLARTQEFNSDNRIAILPERPFFFSFTYLFTKASHVDPFAFLKIIVPFISLMNLLPAWLLARTYHSKIAQAVILTLPLFVPSTIQYQQLPMPQALLILAFYFFLFWLLYTIRRNLSWPYFAAGVAIGLAFFYHEIAALPFLIWILITLIHTRQQWILFLKKNKIVAILVLLLVGTNLAAVVPLINFGKRWLHTLNPYLSTLNFNWYFPAHFVNFDGNSVGWSGADGVIKYYLFYVGPVVLVLLFTALYWTLSYPTTVKHQFKKKEIQVIVVSFLTFFAISEILPRTFSLALLPERSWIFAGILASASVILFFHRSKAFVPQCVLLLCTVSIGGALYINSQKRYIVPHYQVESALLINEHLPPGRILVSRGNSNLLTFHARATTILTPANFYCVPSAQRDQILNDRLTFQLTRETQLYPTATTNFMSDVTAYLQNSAQISIEEISSIAEKHIRPLLSYQQTLELDQLKKNIYIYYYQDDPLNPLRNRPYYVKAGQSPCTYHNFDSDPGLEKIYDNNGQVQIWRYKS